MWSSTVSDMVSLIFEDDGKLTQLRAQVENLQFQVAAVSAMLEVSHSRIQSLLGRLWCRESLRMEAIRFEFVSHQMVHLFSLIRGFLDHSSTNVYNTLGTEEIYETVIQNMEHLLELGKSLNEELLELITDLLAKLGAEDETAKTWFRKKKNEKFSEELLY